MRLTIAAVGRSRESPEQALVELYCDRARALAPKLGVSRLETIVVDTSRAATPQARLTEEAQKLVTKMPDGAHVIALDEAGRAMTSEAFANHLRRVIDSGARDLVFVIGGPDGLAPSLRERAQERLAFG